MRLSPILDSLDMMTSDLFHFSLAHDDDDYKKKTGNAIKISRVAQRVSRWGWIGHWWRFKARYENFFHFPVIVSDHSTNWRTMWPSIVLSGHCRSILCVCEEFLKRRTTDAKGSSGTFEAFIAYEIVRRQNEKKRRFWVLLLCSTWTDCWYFVVSNVYTIHIYRSRDSKKLSAQKL